MKKTMKNLTCASAVACILLAASAAQAQVINFDSPGAFGANYSGQGAYSDPGNNFWNAVPASGGTTPLGFDSSGGFATAIANVLLTFSGGVNEGYNNGGDSGDSVGGLMAPWVLVGGGNTITATLSDVPVGSYDLYLYGMNYPDQDRGVSFTVNGVTQSTLGINALVSNHTTTMNAFVRGGGFDNAGVGGSLGVNAAPANYVVFSLTPDVNGDIIFTFTANPFSRPGGLSPNQDYSGINGEGDFNGLQLVTIPEPSTYAMLTVGFSLLGFNVLKRRGQVSV
jgi:hypothetical protein